MIILSETNFRILSGGILVDGTSLCLAAGMMPCIIRPQLWRSPSKWSIQIHRLNLTNPAQESMESIISSLVNPVDLEDMYAKFCASNPSE